MYLCLEKYADKASFQHFSCVHYTLFVYVYLCTFTMLRYEGVFLNGYIFCSFKVSDKMSTALRKGTKNLHTNFSIFDIFKLLYKDFFF